MEGRKKKDSGSDSGSYRGCKLFLSEDRLEVVRVYCSVASIPPFRIDIPLSSKSIQFCAETTRTELLWQPLDTKSNDYTSNKSLRQISSGKFTRELDKEPLLN